MKQFIIAAQACDKLLDEDVGMKNMAEKIIYLVVGGGASASERIEPYRGE